MRTRTFLLAGLILFGVDAHANFLRSAGSYYAPKEQIEINTQLGVLSRERREGIYQNTSTVTLSGVRFEHGLNDKVSWGANLNYGNGTADLKTPSSGNNYQLNGFFDPEIFIKSHFTGESLRFHANTYVNIKSDAMVLAEDRQPLNFSRGGSALALLLGLEGSLGPTILGLDVRGDLWRDSQEILQKNANINAWQSEARYFRDGGQWLGSSFYAELTHSRRWKPGLRFNVAQISGSSTELQPNQTINGTTNLSSYKLPAEQLMSVSFYGRVRLPSHFVVNFQLDYTELYQNASLDQKVGQNYGLLAQLGYKF